MEIAHRVRLGAVVAAIALAGGIAYAGSTGGGASTVNACAKTEGGQLRLDTGDGCLPSEQAVQLGQGSPDSTVRNMTGFMFEGTTASTPVLSQRGQLGTLSFTCSNLTYATNPADVAAFDDRVMFTSDQVAGSPLAQDVHDRMTVTWASPGNRSFQMLIEGTPDGREPVTLTQINGFVRPFPQFSGCSYFAYVQTSEVRSPQTLTP
jgi:hypothetical protein